MTAFQTAVKLWRKSPPALQKQVLAASKRTGVPYFVWYMSHFDEKHAAEHYAGNLPAVTDRYFRCEGDERRSCERQFERIMDSLVLRNGVTKTTYAGRHGQLLRRILSDPRVVPERASIDVLDVPSSAGMSSLDIHALLSERFTVTRYVLGDLYFNIHVDSDRQCVFDDEGHLLQVRTERGFASVHRPFVMGDEQSPLLRLLMSSHDRRNRKLQEQYLWQAAGDYASVRLLHPEVERAIRDGHMQLRKCDVLAPIDDRFDVILSFNLLQKTYFPDAQIVRGVENLGRSLNQGGILVVGDTTTFTVYRKLGADLKTIWHES